MSKKIYRATSKASVEKFINGSNPEPFREESSGEFGIGCYFWLEDPAAAAITAAQYYAAKNDWGIIELEYDEEKIRQIAKREQGYGSRVLEFKHGREACCKSPAGEASNFVVPKEYSHMTVRREDQTPDYRPQNGASPAQNSYGKMDSEQFRNINASPEKYGIDGKSNDVIWQYDLIIGPSAANYSDEKLVQMKFANHGMTFLNNRAVCTRKKFITGNKVVNSKVQQMIGAWRMSERNDIYKKYFMISEGKNLDLNNIK